MGISLHRITDETNSSVHHDEGGHDVVEVVHGLVYYVCLYAALGTRFVLILDRMVCACSPLKYKRRVTRRRTASTISVMWFLATVLGSVSAMCHYHTRRRMNTVAFIVGSIYLLCAVITYILIVRRLRKSRIQSGRADYQNHNVKLKKEFSIETLIKAKNASSTVNNF